VTSGFGRDRLAMIVAVLGRHAGTMLSSADVFVNIAGGIRIEEPAADLAVAAAVLSAHRGLPLPLTTAVFGEISLTGEVRASGQPERRFAQATSAACRRVLIPAADKRGALAREGAAIGIADVSSLVTHLFQSENGRGGIGDPMDDQGV
jgi:DNA repair protein RadA/Sms